MPVYRKNSGPSPTAKGFRQPPMSAGQARTGGYMGQPRVSGGQKYQPY